jgi:protein TonB
MSAQVDPPLLEVPHSHLAGILALVLALGLHAAFALQNQTNPVEQAGGNTALAAQGNSFANMAAGVETPQEAEAETPVAVATPVQDLAKTQALQPVQPPKTTVAKPIPVQRPKPVEMVKPVTPIEAVAGGVPLVQAALEVPAEPQQTPSLLAQAEPETAVAAPPEVAAVAPSVEALEVVKPAVEQAPAPSVTKDVVPVQEPIPTPEPAVAADPVATTQPGPVEAKVQPPEPQSPPVTQSLRPPERPAPPEPEKPRPAQTKPAPKPTQKSNPKPRGNGEVNATRGVATSTRSQPGGQAQTTGGSAKVQGNAAASNYAGLVMRRIQRAKRRADVRGEALVRFSITAGGGVASLSLARSSGSGKLDGIALAQVRRAAPFPPPPPGARTSFTVRIKGK